MFHCRQRRERKNESNITLINVKIHINFLGQLLRNMGFMIETNEYRITIIMPKKKIIEKKTKRSNKYENAYVTEIIINIDPYNYFINEFFIYRVIPMCNNEIIEEEIKIITVIPELLKLVNRFLIFSFKTYKKNIQRKKLCEIPKGKIGRAHV